MQRKQLAQSMAFALKGTPFYGIRQANASWDLVASPV